MAFRRGGDEGGKGRFKYRSRSEDQLKRRQEQGSRGAGFLKGDHDRFTPHKGENVVRILPPTWDEAEHFGYDAWVHYGIGPDNSSFLCPHKMKGEECPICEERARADAAGDEEYARQLAPSHRVLYWVIDRDNEKNGPLIWTAPWASIDKEITAQVKDSRTGEILEIDHPDHGYDIEFLKEGERDRTKYTGIRISRHESELGRNAEEWLELVQENPLPDLLVFSDYDDIAKAFGGGKSNVKKSRDEDDGSRPSRRKTSDDTELPTTKEIEALAVEELEDLAERLGIDVSGDFDTDDALYDFMIDEVDKLRSKSKSGGDRISRRGRGAEEEKPARDRMREMRGSRR